MASDGYLERPRPRRLADVIETILDKGLVIDYLFRIRKPRIAEAIATTGPRSGSGCEATTETAADCEAPSRLTRGGGIRTRDLRVMSWFDWVTWGWIRLSRAT